VGDLPAGKWRMASMVHGQLDTNTEITDDQWTTIGDLEALLIRAIGPAKM
jgi:hypothetical protein